MKELLCAIVLLWLFPLPGAGQYAREPARFLNGLSTVTLPRADEGALQINKLRRSDSPFDNLQLTLFGDVVFSERWALFTQFMVDPSSREGTLATFLNSYLRYTVFTRARADLHLQAGKLPTPFGTFGARAYADKNPLIGLPLMYYYFTPLRANQLPADNADLLAHRGQGQFSLFTGFAGGGASRPGPGLSMIYEPCWDFGAEAIGSFWRFEYLVGLTQGTLSDPRSSPGDNNDGQQLAARVGLVPATGALMGISYARGPYLDRAVAPVLQSRARGEDVEDFVQEIIGLDAEYSIRRFKLVGELALNRWEVPTLAEDLKSYGAYVEAVYTLHSRLRAAARYSGLRFSPIDGGTGVEVDWDYRVDRWEAGLSYPLYEGVLGKLIWQQTKRSGAEGLDVLALQVTSSF